MLLQITHLKANKKLPGIVKIPPKFMTIVLFSLKKEIRAHTIWVTP